MPKISSLRDRRFEPLTNEPPTADRTPCRTTWTQLRDLQSFPFFLVPRKLRNEIYHNMLQYTQLLFSHTFRFHSGDIDVEAKGVYGAGESLHGSSPAPTWLLVSRDFRDEALEIFYLHAIFSILDIQSSFMLHHPNSPESLIRRISRGDFTNVIKGDSPLLYPLTLHHARKLEISPFFVLPEVALSEIFHATPLLRSLRKTGCSLRECEMRLCGMRSINTLQLLCQLPGIFSKVRLGVQAQWWVDVDLRRPDGEAIVRGCANWEPSCVLKEKYMRFAKQLLRKEGAESAHVRAWMERSKEDAPVWWCEVTIAPHEG